MFEETMNNVTEAVTETVTENIPNVVVDNSDEIVNAVTEVGKNAEWTLDSKSFFDGFVAGTLTFGVAMAIPKIFNFAKSFFRGHKKRHYDDVGDISDEQVEDTPENEDEADE